MVDLLDVMKRFKEFESEFKLWEAEKRHLYKAASNKFIVEEKKANALNLLMTPGLLTAREAVSAFNLKHNEMERKKKALSQEFYDTITCAIKCQEMIPAYAVKFYTDYSWELEGENG